jgi:hypothetical protein
VTRKRHPQNEGEAGKKLDSERPYQLYNSGWRGSLGHPSKAKDSEKFLKIRALLVFEKTLAFRVQSILNATWYERDGRA